MSGNVWEWCLNEYEDPEQTKLFSAARRVVRGGVWGDTQLDARTASRYRFDPVIRNDYLGLRVACSSPIFPE